MSALEAKQERLSSPQDVLKGLKELSEQALLRWQGSPGWPPPGSGPSDSARSESGGGARKSDPGSRDFQLREGNSEPGRGPGQVDDSAEASTSGVKPPKGTFIAKEYVRLTCMCYKARQAC